MPFDGTDQINARLLAVTLEADLEHGGLFLFSAVQTPPHRPSPTEEHADGCDAHHGDESANPHCDESLSRRQIWQSPLMD